MEKVTPNTAAEQKMESPKPKPPSTKTSQDSINSLRKPKIDNTQQSQPPPTPSSATKPSSSPRVSTNIGKLAMAFENTTQPQTSNEKKSLSKESIQADTVPTPSSQPNIAGINPSLSQEPTISKLAPTIASSTATTTKQASEKPHLPPQETAAAVKASLPSTSSSSPPVVSETTTTISKKDAAPTQPPPSQPPPAAKPNNKAKYMNAMDLMKQESQQQKDAAKANTLIDGKKPDKPGNPVAPTITTTTATTSTNPSKPANSTVKESMASAEPKQQQNPSKDSKNSSVAPTSTAAAAVVVTAPPLATQILGPAEKEKLRMEEAAIKMKQVSEMTASVSGTTSSTNGAALPPPQQQQQQQQQSASTVSRTLSSADKKKEEKDGRTSTTLASAKMPSADDMRGRAVCEKIKCEIKVENLEISCVDDKKREVFPTMELRRIVKAEFTAGRPEVTIHACCPRDKGKTGSKFRTIDVVFDGGPLKAKTFAEGLMMLVYGSVTPEKAIFRKVLCLVDRFDKEPSKVIEKYMKPVWAVFNKPFEIKS
ncbi:hypothetical protein BDR26DRAFT_514530 [Obelidium mucronatum]|nr:hypothetical protein BDR26DRAFT_514530 [Obelidium mucronatum]